MAKKKPQTPTDDADWLDPDTAFIDGLDHLGILVVSTNIYARLLPGVSNLTERGRYFSFYPWVFDSFLSRAQDTTQDGWRTWIRRHELVYGAAGTAAEAAADAEYAAGGLVGARAAARMLKDGGVDVATAAALRTKDNRGKTYFNNREGGFGQYYKGPMTDLGLLKLDDEKKAPDRRLTSYAGARIAAAVERIDGFRELRELATVGGYLSKADLARLGAQVHPAALNPDSEEAALLRALLLGDDLDLCQGQTEADRLQRRHSFGLLLDYLAQQDADPWDAPHRGVRWAALEGRLGDSRPWAPRGLASTALAWAAYQQNELLTYGLENLLWAVIAVIDDGPRTPAAIARELAVSAMAALSAHDDRAARPALPPTVDAAVRAHHPPPTDACWGEAGTYQFAQELEDESDPAHVAGRAARLLLRVAADRGRYGDRPPFATIPGGLDLARREIHLRSWWDRVDAAGSGSTEAFFERLILDWVIYRHLRVATRKLAQGDYTYRFRPEQGALVKCGDFEPTFTNPRARQTMRIMADIGLVSPDLDTVLPHGQAFLGALA
jgi:hypothetical protein